MLPDRWVCDAAPFLEAFGWTQRESLGETLAETAGWLKARGKI
jgi:hypothetical protein